MDALMNIYRIEAKNILSFEVLLFLGVTFLVRVCLEIIINNASKSCITDCSRDFFATLYTSIFFVVDQFSQAATAKAMVTWLNCNWN